MDNKKLQYILFVLGIVVLTAFFLLVIVKGFFTYSKEALDFSQEKYSNNVGEIFGPIKVGQSFKARHDRFSAVTVRLANYGREAKGEVVFHLQNTPFEKEDLRTVKVAASKIKDNEFHAFRFEPILDSQDKTYFFYIENPAGEKEFAITAKYNNMDVFGGKDEQIYIERSGKLNEKSIAQAKKPGDLAFGVFYLEKPYKIWQKNIPSYRYLFKWFLAGLIFVLFLFFFNSRFAKKEKLTPKIICLIILLLIIIGFIWRYIYSLNMPATNDEGAYLYDGVLIRQGLHPYKDFLSKEPLFIYLLALFEIIFGRSIFAGRLMSILSGLGTGIFFYFIGKELWSKRLGLLTSFLWLLLPSPIVFNVYVHTQSLQIFFLSLACYLLVHALKRKNLLLYFFHGLAIGIAALARKSALAFGLVSLLTILFLHRTCLKNKIKALLAVGGGFLLSFGGFVLCAWKIYGWQKTLYAIGFEMIKTSISSLSERGEELYINYAIKGITPFFRENLFLILLVFVFIYLVLYFALARFNKLGAKIAGIIPLGIYYYLTKFYFEYEGKMPFYSRYLWYLFGLFLLLLIIFLPHLKLKKRPIKAPYLIFLFWFLGMFIFYALWIKFHANYLVEFYPALIFSAGFAYVWFEAARKKMPRIFSSLLFFGMAILAFWSILISYFVTYNFEHTGTFDLGAIEEAADYLKKNVSEDEEIFTAAAIVPYLSGHPIMLNITHPTWYAYGFIEGGMRDLFLPPSGDMIAYLKSDKVHYFLNDQLTQFSYFREYEEIRDYIKEEFEEVKKFENMSNNLTLYVKK